MKITKLIGHASAAVLALGFSTSPAAAYIGPGVGLGAIAVAVALFLGVLLLIVGLVWYPLKRLLRGRRNSAAEQDETPPDRD